MRPYRKFLSHIEVELGFSEDEAPKKKAKTSKPEKTTSKSATPKVQTPSASK
jgi:hypothetical protein